MAEFPSAIAKPAGDRIPLRKYSADIRLSTLSVGIDNIHYDVFLSPRLVEVSRKYILDLLRQVTNAADFYGMDARSFRPPETSALRKVMLESLQASITHAQFHRNIELDILFRLSLLKLLTQEISSQFNNLLLECKDRIRSRGETFDRSERAYVLRARLAELQADRRNIYRQAGQQLHQILMEMEDTSLVKLRRALFGEEFAESYSLLRNRLVFVEGGRDDLLYLEQYVLLGNFVRDQDRFETIEALFLEFLRDVVQMEAQVDDLEAATRQCTEVNEKVASLRGQLTGLEEQRETLQRALQGGEGLMGLLRGRRDPAEMRAELSDVEKRHEFLKQKLEGLVPQLDEARSKADYLGEQYRATLGDYLYDPENARRLFDPQNNEGGSAELRSRLLDGWVSTLEQRGLLMCVLACYEMRNLYLDYCPPVHLQQLKRALVQREEIKQVEDVLKQFTARQISMKRIEETVKGMRRYLREEIRNVARRYAEDFIRLRRDLRNYQRLVTLMEQITLIRAEPTRELSRMNNSLYELLLADEARPVEDRVVTHVVIKADVRGSTKITQDLLARGLNPASHFSLNLHTPVKRILERYGAARVFIEGDAIILAIYETESNRTHQRAVAKACALAREILAVSQAYNARVEASDLPRLELGVGVAFQDSAPTFWVDSDSRVMISKALNLSDRLSGCSKVARRLLKTHKSPFSLFLFETVMEGAAEEEADELLLRYNLNGIELNEEGFQKLGKEISLHPVECEFPMPWGRDNITLYVGEVPIGEVLTRVVVRQGLVRQVMPNGTIGQNSTRLYYEVCTNPQVIQTVEKKIGASSPSS